MKTKMIIFGAVLAAFLMLAMPCISAVNVQTRENLINRDVSVLDGEHYRLEGLWTFLEGVITTFKTIPIIVLSPLFLKNLVVNEGMPLEMALALVLFILIAGPAYMKAGLVMMVKNIPQHEVNLPLLYYLAEILASDPDGGRFV